MSLTLLVGGARSGKSTLALRRAAAADSVVFIATAEAGDDEMAARIASHRTERPVAWTTVEEPVEIRAAVESSPPESFVILDCLSLWVSNLMGRGWQDEAIEAETARAAAVAAARPAPTVVVTNEVGLGIVPATPLGRRYRDVLGRVNTTFAEAAEEALLVVAGRALRLER
ncbi:MAG TPA: bifunctional adenosylcobinamide kinase/adenosylcobinamide-phosphate guanylyltransferase [Gaiellaceae bacterium]|nr:bifunctional adenosylcobinamide kinase/adenosylcobinamide-phosphate guanylyltransferase [Gaiellaceae bacterium]